MASTKGTVHRYEQLCPDQLAEIVAAAPVAYWPLGLLEHHGWHLPVGLDGLKAEHICAEVAARAGGVLLPTMWWGAGGGHGDFMWTHYQPEEASEAILRRTLEGLIAFGFRAIVLLAGHYPWKSLLRRVVPELQAQHPEVLFLAGTEMDIAPGLSLPGDHAAREEASYGLALFPQWVDLQALKPGRGAKAWPGGQAPPPETWHPGVCFDPASPLYAQMGEDARLATAERGRQGVDQLVARLAEQIEAHLQGVNS